jgi:hypothetical protein
VQSNNKQTVHDIIQYDCGAHRKARKLDVDHNLAARGEKAFIFAKLNRWEPFQFGRFPVESVQPGT